MTEKKDSLKIKGRLFWASVQAPNQFSGKYQVDISIDDKTAKELQAMGVSIKKETDMKDTKHVGTTNDRHQFVTAKRSVETSDGTVLEKPLLVDAKKRPLPPGTALGNGTLAYVIVNPYNWSFKGKKGVGLGFSAIQVLDLVEFKQGGLAGFDEEDGYESTISATDKKDSDESLDDSCPFDLAD